ncbi:MAG: segregation/condensation protein A [Planctomycetes bacterium]|nr:segregation/condensation protein A [Planctomycetota bacterium]
MTYKVDLDIYSGPMDLLLYLIRREEVDVRDLPVARIADQYVAYVEHLQALDIELAGEFVVMAATLLELKSRALLPRLPEAEDEQAEDQEDPRETLIRQLIEYRRYKGAAGLLSDRGRDMARRFPRRFDDDLLAHLEAGADEVPPEDLLEGVEVWDLISAFSDVIRTLGYSEPREVVYDDTPVEEAAVELVQRLERERTVRFVDLFTGGRSINYCIAMFLALLELVRRRRIGAEQDEDFQDLRLYLRDPEAEEPVKRRRPKGAAKSKEAMARKRPRRPSGRSILDDAADTAELEKTEFDEILDSVHVPDVEAFRPLYSDTELMGRGPDDTDEASAEAPDASAEASDEAADDSAEAPDEASDESTEVSRDPPAEDAADAPDADEPADGDDAVEPHP